MYLSERFLLVVSNAEKWGDHQKKKFFINNFVKTLIPFKEEHQVLLIVHLLWGVPVREKNGTIFNLVYLLERVGRALMKKKCGGNGRKRFCSEM